MYKQCIRTSLISIFHKPLSLLVELLCAFFLLLWCITISITISDEQTISSRTTAHTPTTDTSMIIGALVGMAELDEVVGSTAVTKGVS